MSRYSCSQIGLYRGCGLRYFYRIVLGLQRIADGLEGHHLCYGKAMHEALAILYDADYFHQETAQKQLLLDLARQRFLDSYPIQLDVSDQAKTRENGVKALEHYVGHYAFEDLRYKVLQVEELDLDGLDWQLHLDLVVEQIDTGSIYGFDHKFVGGKDSKYLGELFWRRYEINSQVTQYIDQIAQKYGNCDGFYINAIGMGYRSRAYKGEPAGFWVRFGRQMFQRTPEQIQQEWGSVDQAIEAIEKARRDTELGIPSHRAWGFNDQGCNYCEYRPICSAGWSWEQDAELIQIQYRRVCNQVIEDKCPTCFGIGAIGVIVWNPGEPRPIAPICSTCQNSGKHPHAGHRCTLDREHQGPCDERPVAPVDPLADIEVDDA